MASTLIIGIGTTGLSIIEEAQQLHYEFTGKINLEIMWSIYTLKQMKVNYHERQH